MEKPIEFNEFKDCRYKPFYKIIPKSCEPNYRSLITKIKCKLSLLMDSLRKK